MFQYPMFARIHVCRDVYVVTVVALCSVVLFSSSCLFAASCKGISKVSFRRLGREKGMNQNGGSCANAGNSILNEVRNGVNVIKFGHITNIEPPVCVVGGNCSIQAFDYEGNEVFWITPLSM